jgi:hypothetical protein
MLKLYSQSDGRLGAASAVFVVGEGLARAAASRKRKKNGDLNYETTFSRIDHDDVL